MALHNTLFLVIFGQGQLELHWHPVKYYFWPRARRALPCSRKSWPIGRPFSRYYKKVKNLCGWSCQIYTVIWELYYLILVNFEIKNKFPWQTKSSILSNLWTWPPTGRAECSIMWNPARSLGSSCIWPVHRQALTVEIVCPDKTNNHYLLITSWASRNTGQWLGGRCLSARYRQLSNNTASQNTILLSRVDKVNMMWCRFSYWKLK